MGAAYPLIHDADVMAQIRLAPDAGSTMKRAVVANASSKTSGPASSVMCQVGARVLAASLMWSPVTMFALT